MRNSKGQFIKGHSNKHSDKTKKKIAETCKKKGIGKWMKGRKLSEDTKTKQSINSARHWLGKKRGNASEETKRKMSESQKGHKVSEFTRERMSLIAKGKVGKEHPCWKEDKKSPLYKSIRRLYQYKQWRLNVFTRDNFTCIKCFKKGYVEADHYPKRFVDILKENNIVSIEEAINCKELWNINNGRTLCQKCHRETPTWGKKGKR